MVLDTSLPVLAGACKVGTLAASGREHGDLIRYTCCLFRRDHCAIPSLDMDKTYQPQQIESHWYQIWESRNYFAPSGEGESYSIVIPPPNVTGRLHMGHGFQNAIMDALIRYHRMMGRNTLWQVGTDHAGIATQMVVERRLEREGIKRSEER